MYETKHKITGPYVEDEETRDDYHPLTEEQVKELLTIAIEADDPLERNDIHCRLTQGVVGITCPHEADDATEAADTQITDLYLACIAKPDMFNIDSVAQKLHSIMQNPEASLAWLNEGGEI